MINYAKHDDEFHGVFKLVSGEEVLAKAVLTDIMLPSRSCMYTSY